MPGLHEVASSLYSENLFVCNEQNAVKKLNYLVKNEAEKLVHAFWGTRHHHLHLEQQNISGNDKSISWQQHLSALESLQYLDSFDELATYRQLLQNFVAKPSFVANCLALGEEYAVESTSDVAHIIMLCCYGNSFLTDDYKLLLEFVEKLFVLQHLYSDEKAIDDGKSMFTVVFRSYVGFLLGSNLYLTSSLHLTMLEMVANVDVLLETNLQKLITTLSPNKIEQTFGTPNGPNFAKNLKNHAKQAEATLMHFSLLFVNGLLASLNSFPHSLGWILARFYQLLKGNSSDTKARLTCIEILFSYFIYDAIENPEKHGVIEDLVLSDTCKFNLKQIVQTIQTAIRYENEEKRKNSELYKLLKSLRLLMDTIVNTYDSNTVPPIHESLIGWTNNAVLLTPFQLRQLVEFLEEIKRLDAPGIDQSTLNELLSRLPESLPQCLEEAVNWSLATNHASQVSKDDIALPSPRVLTPIGTPVSKAASHDRIFSVSLENILEGPYGETVLVIPLQPETNVDKKLGMLSEAEILGLATTPKRESSVKRNHAKTILEAPPTSYDVSKDFGIRRNKSCDTINDMKKVNENTISDKEQGLDVSDSSSDLDSGDEFHDYHSNAEIRARFASVMRNDQWPSATSVSMVNNDVIEVACQLTEEEDNLDDVQKQSIVDPPSKLSRSTEDLVFANKPVINPDTTVNSNCGVIQSGDDQALTELSQTVQIATGDTELTSSNGRSTSSSCNSEAVLQKEENTEQLLAKDFEALILPSPDNEETHELTLQEKRSRSKAHKLLGVSDTDDDVEWDTKLIRRNESHKKAEKILGVNLLKENKKKSKKSNTVRRATTNDPLPRPSLVDSPKKSRGWRRIVTLKRNITFNAGDFVEMKQNFVSGNRVNRRSRREPAETEEIDVMEKYRRMSTLQKAKKPGFNHPTADSSISSSESFKDCLSPPDGSNSLDSSSLNEMPGTQFLSPNTPSGFAKNNAFPWHPSKPPSINDAYKPKIPPAEFNAFVKKKLRLIFSKYFPPSEMGVPSVQLRISNSSAFYTKSNRPDSDYRNQLLSHLQAHLATTLLMRDQTDHVMLEEVIRCVTMMNENSCCAIVEDLWEEYQKRSKYIAYLVRSKQQLLGLQAHVQRMISTLQRDKSILRHYAIKRSVESFLMRKETMLAEFCNDLVEEAANDERALMMREFLSSLYGQLAEDPAWSDTLLDDVSAAEMEIERLVHSRVYENAIFPNGEVQLERDMMFHEIIDGIGLDVTPQHPSLQIPDIYLIGFPWMEAQNHAKSLSIYRSPRDKLQAAVRCCITVIRMLELADRHAPANDDLMPVLLYVLIKANPPHLISITQYVDDYMGDIFGEEGYLWTVFKSVLEFIKSLPSMPT